MKFRTCPWSCRRNTPRLTQRACNYRFSLSLQMQGIHSRKADGRNLNNLTVATAIFDANGNFVVGAQKTLEMKLEDATNQKLMQGGGDGKIEL